MSLGVKKFTPETAEKDRNNVHIGQLLARIRLIILLKFGTLMGEFIVMALVKYSLVKVINMLIRFNRL